MRFKKKKNQHLDHLQRAEEEEEEEEWTSLMSLLTRGTYKQSHAVSFEYLIKISQQSQFDEVRLHGFYLNSFFYENWNFASNEKTKPSTAGVLFSIIYVFKETLWTEQDSNRDLLTAGCSCGQTGRTLSSDSFLLQQEVLVQWTARLSSPSPLRGVVTHSL